MNNQIVPSCGFVDKIRAIDETCGEYRIFGERVDTGDCLDILASHFQKKGPSVRANITVERFFMFCKPHGILPTTARFVAWVLSDPIESLSWGPKP